MTPQLAFHLLSQAALAGWLCLAAGVLARRPWLRDRVAGLAFPLALSACYALIVAASFPGSSGGFGSLDAVRALFASDWLMVAGWTHYLAFDLFVGAWIARRTMEQGLSRVILIPVLPLTFLFGPAGLALFLCLRSIVSRTAVVAAD